MEEGPEGSMVVNLFVLDFAFVRPPERVRSGPVVVLAVRLPALSYEYDTVFWFCPAAVIYRVAERTRVAMENVVVLFISR